VGNFDVGVSFGRVAAVFLALNDASKWRGNAGNCSNCRRREEGELIFSGKNPVEKLSVNPAEAHE
jgi:hypothetical protein